MLSSVIRCVTATAVAAMLIVPVVAQEEEDINPIPTEEAGEAAEVGASAEGAACEPYELMLATTPIPPQSPSRLKVFDRDIDKLPEKVDIVAFGDSQLATWPSDELKATFEGKRTYNLALNGDYVQNALWRLQRPELTSIDPKLALVMIGGANLSQYSGCAIAAGTNLIVDRIREVWPNAYILRVDITPRGTDFTQRDDRRLEANELVRQHLAAMPNTGTANFDKALTCDQYLNTPWHVSIARAIGWGSSPCENYRDDLTHFTKTGYGVLASEILRTVQEHGVEL